MDQYLIFDPLEDRFGVLTTLSQSWKIKKKVKQEEKENTHIKGGFNILC